MTMRPYRVIVFNVAVTQKLKLVTGVLWEEHLLSMKRRTLKSNY